jgi:glutamate-1-semialdehyde 2,1-aminomutase/spore coat polysaccharide biosynthesis protein SpsF
MTTAIIIQARMRSSRLPGKVMLDLGGRTVLSHVIERCRAVSSADAVCIATVDSPPEDPIADEACRCGAAVFRGSENDVLARYHHAAVSLGATTVMRVTSDCPLIDPDVCEMVLAEHRRGGWDYTANNLARSWPHGLDCEAMTAGALARAHASASQPAEREHVTPWLRRNPHLRRANVGCPEPNLAGLRWTLDYPEDIAFFRALWTYLPKGALTGWRQVCDHLLAHPELQTINAAHKAY